MQPSVPFAASQILKVAPIPVRSFLQIAFYYLFTRRNEHTIVIDENCGISRNEFFDAARIYLHTKISPSTQRFKVSMTSRQKNLDIGIEPGQEITDTFENFHLKWKFISTKSKDSGEKRFFELIFNKKFNERVRKDYLPSVLAKSKEIKKNKKVLKLYTRNGRGDCKNEGGRGIWGSIDLEHPVTFDTLAMDPGLKKAIMNDLKRFVNRRDFYKKVGKAWKRGYLLYGPPGTGKSSLIAAMANYLQFDIYDVDLTGLHFNHDLRTIMLLTTNRSIIVFEDIDCSMEEIQDRIEDINWSVEKQNRLFGNLSTPSKTKLTLSGLLNMIDGVWSSCGDERIIVFTTNHKDRIDPALLRPGRMDMQIHMSYCSAEGFKFLASNYLDNCSHHQLFGEIENLIENVEVTPAEVTEELIRSEDADVALGGVVKLLKRKQIEAIKIGEEKTSAPELQQAKRLKTDCPKKRAVRKCRKNSCKMSARS